MDKSPFFQPELNRTDSATSNSADAIFLTVPPAKQSAPKQQLWRWHGLTLHGEPATGVLWASHRGQVLLELQQLGICTLTLRRLAVRARHWRGHYRLHFIRQLASLLQAGISLTSGLQLLAQQHPQPQWQALAAHLARRLQEGIAFNQAISHWPEVFPPLFTALLQTGELTGRLDECCLRLADQQEQQLGLQQKVGKALRYPVVILVLAIVITVGMLTFVLPEFAAIYQSFNASLPLITHGLLAASRFLTQHTLSLCLLILTSGMLFFSVHQRPTTRLLWQRFLYRLPVIRTLLQSQRLSQIYTVLALCQQSGLPLLQGLDTVISTQTCPLWRPAISRLRQKISEGSPFWQAIASEKLFSGLCVQLIRGGETSGTLDLMLHRLAHWHSGQAQQLAERLASALEPAMMLIIGSLIGSLVIAMYLPIFQLGDIMGGV